MAGTKDGGILAAKRNKELYGDNFYKDIGRIGGQNGKTGGFYTNRKLASTAGRKGGKISRRGSGVRITVKSL